MMTKLNGRLHLRRRLAAHLAELGYTNVRPKRSRLMEPELVRVSPTRGHIAFGEIVAKADLNDATCHQRLVHFSQRRTRHRSTILFFIGVTEADEAAVVALLERLDIRGGSRGGHVQVVPLDLAEKRPPNGTGSAGRTSSASAAPAGPRRTRQRYSAEKTGG
jgi:hypothetical protein